MFTRTVVAVLTVALTGQALAQRAEADAAFERGRMLMERGDTAGACTAFETSLKLDPTSGTLYNLGLCHEKLGKLASAWSELRKIAETDANKRRSTDAARRAAALEPRLTRMRLVIAGPTDGVTVRRDGVEITALIGQVVPVDPARYAFEVTFPGRPPTVREIELVGEGKTIDVELAPEDAPTGPTAPAGYPRELVLRPLVLPGGMYELSVSSSVATRKAFEQTPVDGALGARIGVGRFELAAQAGLHLRYDQLTTRRPSPLSAIVLGARYALTPMFAGGIEYVRLHPFGDTGHGSDLRGTISRKLRLAPRIALDARGGFVFSQRQRTDSNPNELALESRGRLQFTATSRLSFEASLGLDLNLGGTLFGHTTTLATAVLGQYALTRGIDVYARGYVGLLPAAPDQSADDFRSFTIGALWRPR